jgi:hypothetical protein
MAKVDLGRILVVILLMVFYYGYYCVQVHFGMICLIVRTPHRTKDAIIEGSSNGYVLVYLNRFSVHWQQIYMNAEDWIYQNVILMVLLSWLKRGERNWKGDQAEGQRYEAHGNI